MSTVALPGALVIVLLCLYFGVKLMLATSMLAAYLLAATLAGWLNGPGASIGWVLFLGIGGILNIPLLRRMLIARPLMIRANSREDELVSFESLKAQQGAEPLQEKIFCGRLSSDELTHPASPACAHQDLEAEMLPEPVSGNAAFSAFLQLALACHPFLRLKLKARQKDDVARFDHFLWSHGSYFFATACRSLVVAITGEHFLYAPPGMPARAIRKLKRFSCHYALVADMVILHGRLYTHRKIGVCLWQCFFYMTLAAALLQHYYTSNNSRQRDRYKMKLDYCLFQAQQAMGCAIQHFHRKGVRGWLLKRMLKTLVFPFGRPCRQTAWINEDRQPEPKRKEGE